jgi:hypothetical protein
MGSQEEIIFLMMMSIRGVKNIWWLLGNISIINCFSKDFLINFHPLHQLGF